MLSTLLNELDGIETYKNVLIIAATNKPWDLDDALLRPGRLDLHLLLGLPSNQDKLDILKHLSQKIRFPFASQIDFTQILQEITEMTGSELIYIIREAAYSVQNQQSMNVEERNILQAIAEYKQKSNTSLEDRRKEMLRYTQFMKRK